MKQLAPLPYRLRRWRDGGIDREFHPEYHELGWAISVANEYREPGAVIEVVDARTGAVVYTVDELGGAVDPRDVQRLAVQLAARFEDQKLGFSRGILRLPSTRRANASLAAHRARRVRARPPICANGSLHRATATMST